MTSRLNPNVWNGEERSGGYIGKNDRPASAKSPDFSGRLYLKGVGWFWLSGWWKDGRQGELLKLRVQEMTDAQAQQYCKQKPQTKGRPTSQPTSPQNGAEPEESDIPF